ncbi:hypothetical protein PMAYCL1PPCAC_10256, partial [Pristionchus mayeri]
SMQLHQLKEGSDGNHHDMLESPMMKLITDENPNVDLLSLFLPRQPKQQQGSSQQSIGLKKILRQHAEMQEQRQQRDLQHRERLLDAAQAAAASAAACCSYSAAPAAASLPPPTNWLHAMEEQRKSIK